MSHQFQQLVDTLHASSAHASFGAAWIQRQLRCGHHQAQSLLGQLVESGEIEILELDTEAGRRSCYVKRGCSPGWRQEWVWEDPCAKDWRAMSHQIGESAAAFAADFFADDVIGTGVDARDIVHRMAGALAMEQVYVDFDALTQGLSQALAGGAMALVLAEGPLRLRDVGLLMRVAEPGSAIVHTRTACVWRTKVLVLPREGAGACAVPVISR